MADDQTARITVALPKEVTKALRMKAINDECSPSEIIINALVQAYPNDELLTKPLNDAASQASEDSAAGQSASEYGSENESDS